jgi:HNH endonuclease
MRSAPGPGMSDRPATSESVSNAPREVTLDDRLQALASVASVLEWPVRRERDPEACYELARIVDGLLTCGARGRGAVDVAIGDCLDALSVGERALELGYSNIPDYAREEHGIPASTAVKMMRLSRALRSRSLLHAAVREGAVSISKAEAIVSVARGEGEAAWVARARVETVRALREAVEELRRPGAAEDAATSGGLLEQLGNAIVRPVAIAPACNDDDEAWTRLCVDLPPGGQEPIDEGLRWGRRALRRATAAKWEVLVASAQEWLGTHGTDDEDAADQEPVSGDGRARAEAWLGECLEPLGESLDEQVAYWSSLVRVPLLAAPVEPEEREPHAIHAQLVRHLRKRAGWDRVFGHLALVMKHTRGCEIAGFHSFAHYCEERLGISVRAVEQRIALERRLHDLPALRAAVDDGRLSYEKARLVARCADSASVQARIEQAERMRCIDFRRKIDADEDAQMSARRKFAAVMPAWAVALVRDAFRSVREHAGAPLTPGECVVALFRHLVEVWKPVLTERYTVQHRVLERDGYRCKVPGCSRAAAHAHHIVLRSQGGTDDPSNLVSLCATHHLRGVHMGRIRVSGKAPDQLKWELGIRRGVPMAA